MKITQQYMGRLMWILVWLSSFFIGANVSAQNQDSLKNAAHDSARKAFTERIQEMGRAEAASSIAKYNEGRIHLEQRSVMEELKKTNEKIKIYLQHSIDTASISDDIQSVENYLAIVKEGIVVHRGTAQTQRNLSVSSAIIDQLIGIMGKRKATVDRYASELMGFRDRIDSLSSDSVLYIYPTDTAGLIRYYKKMVVVVKEIAPIDTALNVALSNVQDLQVKTDLVVYELRSSYENIEAEVKKLAANSLNREYPNIWQTPTYSRPFGDIIRFSIAKELLALQFYASDNLPQIFLLLVLIVMSTLFIRRLKLRLKQTGTPKEEIKTKLITRYPLLSAILIVVSIFQFIFITPPFIFSFLIWPVSAVCLTIIFYKYITRFWMIFWIVMVLLFTIACATNMLLQASRVERWIMVILALAGIVYALCVFFSGRSMELREKRILYFIAIFIVTELLALVFNIYGRYNLSKTFLISGYIGIVVAILFLWTVQLINEGLSIATSVYRHPDRQLFYINFNRIGNKSPAFLYVLLIIGWFVVVGRNFYEFKSLAWFTHDFLTKPRSLGNYDFTINGIAIFITILFCSLFLSQIVSFFSVDHSATRTGEQKKGKIGTGSLVLLLRIFIISAGLFLAFAAAGIPLDRITIILGALGVGIGLGLQGLVNNLVSGLVIAFERPVNIGDIIEVHGKLGTMKSIGFRSSIISLSDGACLVIPNGDLLSQHLTNWTMGKNAKRVTLQIGVAYGTDLDQVKNILTGVLKAEEKIMAPPDPIVIAKDFNDSSIDFQVIFWVHHIAQASEVTSDIITRIDKAFKDSGVVIPFPQQDLYIHKIDR
ncbi:mechanosensitive ion channel family protein [Taibaiella soli]|uniref:Mechanosensitive ion channel protein n=1 Tax=Taibaiella soli TaxID=1649169 RepID=A0A2W2BTS3_9BACT|nr:mechanosensitive ion channel domain-containing protein [Taibaiella soli]PZF71203.1 mechanosensitive ion channel protein [Taibaiella soli]